MPRYRRRFFIAILLTALPASTQLGCTTIGIPSRRNCDSAQSCDQAQSCGPLGDCHGSDLGCDCGGDGCLGWDDSGLDSLCGETKLPEIPWPRYHPVPTRPVFGVVPASSH